PCPLTNPASRILVYFESRQGIIITLHAVGPRGRGFRNQREFRQAPPDRGLIENCFVGGSARHSSRLIFYSLRCRQARFANPPALPPDSKLRPSCLVPIGKITPHCHISRHSSTGAGIGGKSERIC